jgi:hypothetical protein
LGAGFFSSSEKKDGNRIQTYHFDFSKMFYDEITVRLCGATVVALRPDQIRHFLARHLFTRKMINDRRAIECDLGLMLFLRERVIEEWTGFC